MRVRSMLAGVVTAVLAVGLSGSICGTPPGRSGPELIQEQACVANIQKEDYNAAESRCDLCLEYNERNPECLNAMGLIWYARGVDDKAREYFKKAIREYNDFAQPRNNMGVVEFQVGNYENAADLFASAVEIDPAFLDGRYNLALAYLRLGQRATSDGKDPIEWYKKAEVQYRRIFELYPNHTQSYHDMGVIMTYRAEAEKLGNKRADFISDAEKYFVRCLELDPAFETCHGNIAHLFLSVGRYDESLFHYVQCLAANKNNPICATELQQAYAGSQFTSVALKQYMNQLMENPGYGAGHYGFCIALFDKGLVEMAVTECENAVKLDSSLCLSHYQLAKHYKAVLDKDLALQNCRALITCAGEGRYGSEVGDCKQIVQALEVQ